MNNEQIVEAILSLQTKVGKLQNLLRKRDDEIEIFKKDIELAVKANKTNINKLDITLTRVNVTAKEALSMAEDNEGRIDDLE
jgi:hypothetical protein